MLIPGSFRFGAIAFGLSSILILLAQLLHPVSPVDFTLDPASAAQVFSSPEYQLADLFFLLSFTLLVFGFMAMYTFHAETEVEPWARLAMVLGLAGITMFQSFSGIAAFVFPAAGRLYLQGQTTALDVLRATVNGPAILVALLGGLSMAISAFLFCFVIWRMDILPRWSAVIFAIGLVFFVAAPASPVEIQKVMRIVNGLLAATGGLWLMWAMLQLTPRVVLDRVPQQP